MYTSESMLTFEGEAVMGAQNIVQKIASMPFKTCKHIVVKKDFQPNPFNNGVMIFVTGNLVIDGEEDKPLKFAQVRASFNFNFLLCV